MPALSFREKILYTAVLSPAIYVLTVMWLIPEGYKYAPASIIFGLLAFVSLKGWTLLPRTNQNPRKPYLILILVSTFWLALTYKINDGNISELRTLVSISVYLLLIYRFELPLIVWRACISGSCIVLSCVCLYQFFALDISRTSLHYNPIPFATGLAFMMIASCALAFRESGRIKILDLGVATLSLAAIATTGTRGILAPSILVVLCALYWGVKNTNLSRKGKAAATSLVLLTLLAGTLSVAYDRIGQTVDDLERMQAGDLGGSIGLRFQFWKGAAVMASESPFLGIGNRHFEEFQDLKEHDVVDRQALDYAPYHYHNQFLDNLVKRGVPGLLLLLATLAIPVVMSLRSASASSWRVRAIALIVFMTAAASLTDVPLNHPPVIFTFYILTFCLLPTRRYWED